jgi:hypothetical protein
MALWQLDIVGGAFLADGTEAKIVTGVDDHSRYCVICQVVPRATGRAVCLAFAAALRAFGMPDEVLTDNGKQFTARFGNGGEVLFDRICRDNGIAHRLTQPRSPTTTGKIERFHGSLRRELLDDAVPFADLAAAQAAVGAWVDEYNTTRPHQGIGMSVPAERFTSRKDSQAEELLPLRLPAALTLAPALPTAEPSPPPPAPVLPPQGWAGEAVEFDRVVPPSGNMWVASRQFWLGTGRAGMVITFWADTQVIHLSAAGTRIKSLRSHLSTAGLAKLIATGARQAGPPPLPPPRPSPAVEVDRTVNRNGMVGLGGRTVLAAEILAGRRVGIRIEHNTLMFFDPTTRQLLRTRPSPFTPEQAQMLQGARPAGPPPQPSTAPVTVQRHPSATGVIVVAGQKSARGRTHAGQTVTVHVTATTMTIGFSDGGTQTVTRTTSKPVRSFKAQQHRKAAHVS